MARLGQICRLFQELERFVKELNDLLYHRRTKSTFLIRRIIIMEEPGGRASQSKNTWEHSFGNTFGVAD